MTLLFTAFHPQKILLGIGRTNTEVNLGIHLVNLVSHAIFQLFALQSQDTQLPFPLFGVLPRPLVIEGFPLA